MKLYIWNSERFEDYLEGTIIAIGSNVKEARKNALENYLTEWPVTKGNEWDEKNLKLFKADISVRPLTAKAINLYGSS